MRHRQAALGHHLHQVSQAQLESKIPTHAQDNDLAVEVAALEQLLHAPQLAHCRPSASSAASIADWRPLFAPRTAASTALCSTWSVLSSGAMLEAPAVVPVSMISQ